MLYNRCTGIYKFGNNTYPWRIRRRSNLGHIFGGKSASYGPGNMVYIYIYIYIYIYGSSMAMKFGCSASSDALLMKMKGKILCYLHAVPPNDVDRF